MRERGEKSEGVERASGGRHALLHVCCLVLPLRFQASPSLWGDLGKHSWDSEAAGRPYVKQRNENRSQ